MVPFEVTAIGKAGATDFQLLFHSPVGHAAIFFQTVFMICFCIVMFS